jgi:pyrophosphate--fructose-6-phosphate 1-phosphotransferase
VIGAQTPFEKALRKRKLEPLRAFGTANNVRPIGFVPAGEMPVRAIGFDDEPRELLRGGKPLTHYTKRRVAVLFSGGPASGGHNVIAGLSHALKKCTLLGVRGGPAGLLRGDMRVITAADIRRIQSTGGFDLLGTDRTKLKTPEQFATVRHVCTKHRIDAIVIIGGDDSNTNAAFLARALRSEHETRHARPVQVIGVPKTMDGDLRHGKELPVSFGFDTACRTYAELVGNVGKDALSTRKYWHVIRLMGRSASHVTLEVALQTRPTITLISEEIRAKGWTLNKIVDTIAQIVIARARAGKHYGVMLVPEGLLEFIPEFNDLLDELSAIITRQQEVARMSLTDRATFVTPRLSTHNAALFGSLPHHIKEMLVRDRDAHGNVTVSQIETERLLIDMVAERIRRTSPQTPFATITHFFGYEGRCGAPTAFDARLAYNLGLTAGSLVMSGQTGYMAAVGNFDRGGAAYALPISALLRAERRGGSEEFVIEKALVQIDSAAFRTFARARTRWAKTDMLRSPGPIQLDGPAARQMPITVALDQRYKSAMLRN